MVRATGVCDKKEHNSDAAGKVQRETNAIEKLAFLGEKEMTE